jgi:predicted peptidase
MPTNFVGHMHISRILALGGILSVLVAISANGVANEQPSPNKDASRTALSSLEAELAKGELWGLSLAAQDFARVALTKEDAAKARELLWLHHVARIAKERKEEIDKGLLKLDKHEMPFFLKTFGAEPKEGWSLWISMHGGGGAPKAVNDQQWENQKRLYRLEEGIYVAPRAPTDNWNLWHESHIDDFFDRLIEDLIVLKHVDPNRVYIMGYSAGGDGVYQLAPRMADRWAAAAMMAGHPNDASWLGLRNLGFAIQAGGMDAAYSRNKIAKQWVDKLDELQRDDPKGYVHFGKIFENKGHWMDGEDAKVLPWMAALRRNPIPDRVVWKQSSVTHDRLYWLAIPKNDPSLAGAEAVVERAGQTITIKSVGRVDDLLIRLDDRMVNLDQPVRVVYRDRVLFDRHTPRTIATLIHTLSQRGDPQLMFDAEVDVKVPSGK